jgi:hypothetical protein
MERKKIDLLKYCQLIIKLRCTTELTGTGTPIRLAISGATSA